MRSSGKTMMSVLETARPDLPEGLLDETGYQKIAAIADQLPLTMSTFWGIECRLGKAGPWADVLYRVDALSLGSQLLAGETPSCLERLHRRHPVWGMLRSFAGKWMTPEHYFYRGIRNLWLEFDTESASSYEEAASMISGPSIFFGPSEKNTEEADAGALVLEKLPQIIGASLDSASAPAVLESLPDDANLFQAGYMLARENRALRICLNRMTAGQIPAWLVNNNWPGDPARFSETLDILDRLGRHLALNLSVGERGIEDKIGIECYMDWLEESPAQWIPLFDFIRENGLCRTDKQRGLLEFPGISCLPDQERRTENGFQLLNLFRKIHHIKIVFKNGLPVEAKAYLAFVQPILDPKMLTPSGAREMFQRLLN